jgi:hypothetical protein
LRSLLYGYSEAIDRIVDFMSKLMAFVLFSFSLVGVSGCSSSECKRVQDLEKPAYEALMESEISLKYWRDREASDLATEMEICRPKLKLNRETLEFEKVGEVCRKEKGGVTETVLNALKSAEARYASKLGEWQKIIKLYPNCFDPEKVIRANS